MKQVKPEQKLQADPELDAVLTQMAEEVPPMPADFHQRWMNAVRADAEESKRVSADGKTQQKTISLIRWTRILSVAAAFIFLIGGTMLYRNSKKTLNTVFHMEEKAAEDMRTEAPAAAETQEAAEEETAEAAEAPSAGEDTASGAVMADAAVENAAEEAETSFGAAPALFMNAAKSKEAAEADMDGEAEDSAAMEEPKEALPAAGMPMPLMTSMPTMEPIESAEETEAGPAESEPEPEGGFLQDAGAFLADMGDFLLAALPYLAVLAVPAAAALVFRRKKRKAGR